VVAAFLAFPLWFVLGLGAFVWPIVAVPMLFHLLSKRRVEAPRGFGVWLMFLGWMLISGLQVGTAPRGIVFLYRAALYASATVLFVYVYNLGPGAGRRIASVMAWFFVIVTAGGYVGLMFPAVTFQTLTETFVPKALLANEWLHTLVHVRFAQVQSLVYGTQAVSRPSAPFVYTNEWGSNAALLLPFAIASAVGPRSVLRLAARVAIVLCVVPLALSGNRGAWVSIVLALAYAAVRLAARGRPRLLVWTIVAGLLAGILIVSSSIGTVLEQRAVHPESNRGRLALYHEAVVGVGESPVFGFGGPKISPENPNAPAVGTHGQLWTVLYSHGIPGAVFYMGFLLLALWRTRKAPGVLGFWLNVTIFIVLIQSVFYDALPTQAHVVMVAAALAWRKADDPVPSPARVAIGQGVA
jgi:hypothetical protein